MLVKSAEYPLSRSIYLNMCLDTPPLKELSHRQVDGNAESGRELQSLPVKGMKE